MESTGNRTSRLVVQDDAEEAAMDRRRSAVVIDKAQRPELIHELTDSRPGCADYFCQGFLIDSGKNGFSSAFLAKMSQQ